MNKKLQEVNLVSQKLFDILYGGKKLMKGYFAYSICFVALMGVLKVLCGEKLLQMTTFA